MTENEEEKGKKPTIAQSREVKTNFEQFQQARKLQDAQAEKLTSLQAKKLTSW